MGTCVAGPSLSVLLNWVLPIASIYIFGVLACALAAKARKLQYPTDVATVGAYNTRAVSRRLVASGILLAASAVLDVWMVVSLLKPLSLIAFLVLATFLFLVLPGYAIAYSDSSDSAAQEEAVRNRENRRRSTQFF